MKGMEVDVEGTKKRRSVIGAVIIAVMLALVFFSAPVVTVEADLVEWTGDGGNKSKIGIGSTQQMRVNPYHAVNVEMYGCDYFRTEENVEIDSCRLKLIP